MSGREARIAAAAKRRAEEIQSLSAADRAEVERMDLDGPNSAIVCDSAFAFDTIAPGDEGFDFSHEGGEYAIYETVANEVAGLHGRRQYFDRRDRRDRVEISTYNWNIQLDDMVDAYLEYRNMARPTWTDRHFGQYQESGNCSADLDDPPGTFYVEYIDVFERHRQRVTPQSSDCFPNVSLLRVGCLGTSPLHPTVAISLRSLELYRQMHRVCPRLSIQAQARLLCYMHNIPYRSYLSHQFSDAFDIYLEILHRVDARVSVALGRDTPNWRLRNTCPACFYKLEDEPALKFSFLCEMDGNNSLKRIDFSSRGQVERLDNKHSRSDYWLTPVDVDIFKHEVKASSNDVSNDDLCSTSEQPDVLNDGSFSCIDRWRNAGPEQRKRMFAMFAESGIFIVACRHGNVLLACDMIQSGELAKYPLAMVNKLMEIHGSNIACGYDIGCTFSKTLSSSSLGPRASELGFRLIMGSFHGHAHNRACQLDWHPHHVTGMGRADFEGCERIFASSNALAPGTRHASSFHRHQAIEQHFAFWDEDKYAALSRFLSNHYREALKIVKDGTGQLKTIQDAHGISDDHFTRFLSAEKSYLQGLKAEPPEETLQFQYIEALDTLRQHRANWLDAQALTQRLYGSIATPETIKAMQKAVRKVSSLAGRIETTEQHVLFIEDQLGLQGARWSEASEEYRVIKQKVAERNYRRALDELERLVVQRLFELSKLNVSGTGYKLRTHIAKALQRRSEAIRKALSRYNEHAERLTPPRPTLAWKQVVEYSFLGEFDLLRHARNDVRQEDWAQPAIREATVQYLGLLRAREELVRLEVEIPRLRTRMADEQLEYEDAIKRTEGVNASLAAELRRRWSCRQMINNVHEKRLRWIIELPEYGGLRETGIREGKRSDGVLTTLDGGGRLSDTVVTPDGVQEVDHDDHDEDSFEVDMEALDSFVDSIDD